MPKEYSVGAGHPVRMVVLGDSTVMGVGAGSLEATLPYRVASALGYRVSVTNLAVSGVGALATGYQLARVPKGTDWALVAVTANDATRGTSPSDVEDDIKTILDGLEERGVERVILSTTPNFRTTPALPWVVNRTFENRAAKLTRTIRKVAARYPFVLIADLNSEGTLSEGEYADDGFHPNAAGYEAWAAVFLRSSDFPR